MTDQIAGVCPVCDAKIMRPWRYEAQAFGRQTLIHFACLATWNRVIGAWHTELADRPILEQEPSEDTRAKQSRQEPAGMSEPAKTSPGPVNCSIQMRFQNKTYPRTCERCGLGPCPFFNSNGTPKL